MKAVSEEIYSFFTSTTAFTDVVSDRLHPIVAPENTEFPFATYRIVERRGETKDANIYDIDLAVFFKDENYTACAEFSETLKGIIDSNRDYDWTANEIGFIQEDRTFIANVTFQII